MIQDLTLILQLVTLAVLVATFLETRKRNKKSSKTITTGIISKAGFRL